jgi:hypothetical protein
VAKPDDAYQPIVDYNLKKKNKKNSFLLFNILKEERKKLDAGGDREHGISGLVVKQPVGHFTSHLVPTIIPELPNTQFSFCGFSRSFFFFFLNSRCV